MAAAFGEARALSERTPTGITDAVASFIADLEAQTRLGSANSYRHVIKPLIRLNCPVSEITPAVMRAVMIERSRVVKPSSLLTLYFVCASFFRWCQEQGLIAVSPLQGVPKPKQRRPQHRYLTADQLRACYQNCKTDTDRLIILLCGGSGLRAGEFVGLKWRDVDFEAQTIRVFGKGSKWRTLAPGALAFDVLSPLQGSATVAGCTTNQAVRQRVQRIARRAGIAYCTTHMLRHSFALAFLEATDDAFALQSLLGHANPAMTAYYVRDQREAAAVRKQRAVNLSAKLFGE